MGILVARYRANGGNRWGRLEGDAPSAPNGTVRLRPFASQLRTTQEIVAAYRSGDLAPGKTEVAVETHDLLSPITDDATLTCQGLNYQDHAAESQHAVRKSNLIFQKASSSLTGAFDAIVRPVEVQLLDYEVEFGIVIGKPITNRLTMTAANLGDYIAGVVLANDVSARDVMFGASFLQWFQGKSYRTFCPAGPVLYLMEPGEVVDTLANLEIKLWVNGELRQSAKSSQLIFGPAETLSTLSTFTNLKVGDVVLTGTPGGVTAPATPAMVEIIKTHLLADAQRRELLREEMTKGRPFLEAGDVVRASLFDLRSNRSLGGLENHVVDGA